MAGMIVEGKELPTSARTFYVRDPENNWYYEVILIFRGGIYEIGKLHAYCKCFRKIIDDEATAKMGEWFKAEWGPVIHIQVIGPLAEYVEENITFKNIVDPKTIDLTYGPPPWDALVTDIAETHKKFVDKVLAAEY
jgi:hypothetical protein